MKGAGAWSERPPANEHLRRHPSLVDDLLAEEAVDHVIYRPEADDRVHVRSRRGAATIALEGGKVRYELHGADPFGYGPLPELMDRAEVLERTLDSDYPDAPLQVAQVFDSPRAGDFLISASPGYDLRWREGRVDMQSCHGTLHREHMMVPFAISHPIGPRPPRSVDAFPTILQLLGREVPSGIDGCSRLPT
jgi:hypothetical protein